MINTNFNKEKWQKHYENWQSWWNHELDRPLVVIETSEPTLKYEELLRKYPEIGCPAHFPLTEPAEKVIDFFEAQIESTKFLGDSWPRWWPNFGSGLIAGFLGAKLDIRPDTVWFAPPEDFDFFDFDISYDETNKWFKRVYELSEEAVNRWQDEVNVCFTDIGGNLDILLHFRSTEKLLMDLYDRPDLIKEYLNKITNIWQQYYGKFYEIISKGNCGTSAWTGLWSPGKHYILQCDFSYMISPEMFEEFAYPDLVECCEHLDHPFYHLDGRGQIPHLDILLGMEKLCGIQWIPGDGSGQPEDYPDLLKRIIDAGKLCQVYVTPEGALKIKDELGGKGFVFQIVHNGMDESSANELVSKLYS